MSRMIDTHVHIDFYDNPIDMADEYEAREIYTLFMTHLPELFAKYERKYSSLKYVKLAVGYHPHMFGNYPFREELFLDCMKRTKYVGEVGMDGGKGQPSIAVQEHVFRKICSHSGDQKILSIHSRRAEEEVLRVLVENRVKFAIFHWYSGPLSLVESILDAGYYFSVNSNMLQSTHGRRVLERLSPERLLVETDGPFTKINGQQTVPKLLPELYHQLSDFYGNEQLRMMIYENFRCLLKCHDRTALLKI